MKMKEVPKQRRTNDELNMKNWVTRKKKNRVETFGYFSQNVIPSLMLSGKITAGFFDHLK